MRIAIFVSLAATTAHAAAGPRLAGSGSAAKAALRIARSAYASRAAEPARWLAFPNASIGTPLLREWADAGSGEDSVWYDAREFDRAGFHEPGPAPTLYFGRSVTHGFRLVMVEEPVTPRFTQYSLFAAPAAFGTREAEREFRRGRSGRALVPLVRASWRAPVVFRDSLSGALCAIDLGSPRTPLDGWRIFAAGASGMRKVATIEMRAPGDPATALPPEVRAFATLLARVLADPGDEGTFQATGMLRQELATLWADAALRPWAVGDTYRTRADADSDLAVWARSSAARESDARRIRSGLAAAEPALARYYASAFGRDANQSRALAAFVLDVAYRSHFRHPSDEMDEPEGGGAPNPWWGSVR